MKRNLGYSLPRRDGCHLVLLDYKSHNCQVAPLLFQACLPSPGKDHQEGSSRKVLTFFALELPFALLVDKAGRQRAEKNGSSEETNCSHNARQHGTCQSFISQLWLRKYVWGEKKIEDVGRIKVWTCLEGRGGSVR